MIDNLQFGASFWVILAFLLVLFGLLLLAGKFFQIKFVQNLLFVAVFIGATCYVAAVTSSYYENIPLIEKEMYCNFDSMKNMVSCVKSAIQHSTPDFSKL
tara:strand:+ start:475 stop:774 length:300 start_codon:yes stop_codon:yes gene_type:complete